MIERTRALSSATLAVWGGEDDRSVEGGVSAVATVSILEEKVRLLEGAEASASFATGMAAVSTMLFELLSPGDRVVSVKDTYGDANRLFLDELPRVEVRVDVRDAGDRTRLEEAIAEGCSIVYLETPTNPMLKVLDIARLAELGHRAGAIVVVDNTVATPINQQPLSLGADLVVHSDGRHLSGHADLRGGVLCGRRELVDRVARCREITGAVLDPAAACLLNRCMRTLSVRVRQRNESALAIARWLKVQPLVARVYYPGLETHPGHDVAARQMSGYGGLLSFLPAGGIETAQRMVPRLQLASRGAHLGTVETCAALSAASCVEWAGEQWLAMGIPGGLVRYSVGIESAEDLIDDLAQAFAAA